MIYNNDDVKQWLPHRDPFLFVDTVESVVFPGKSDDFTMSSIRDLLGGEVVAHYKTRADHPIFAGHFPGRPILPGVVQIEMMAQASSFILAKASPRENWDKEMDVALLSVGDSKFRKPVLPEYDLTIKSTCIKARGNFVSYECSILMGDELCSQTICMASVNFN